MVAKYRNRDHVLHEVVMALGLYLAWLEGDE